MSDLKGPRGAPDIRPPESATFQRIMRSAEDAFVRYGFKRIDTPAFEHTEVFTRTQEATGDMVTKEMYEFKDRSGRSLTLRPEGTAPVIRAVLEHNLHRAGLPVKLYYFSTSFRYERPQEGRQRAFHQLGVEAVGAPGPGIDAEVIELGTRVFQMIGLDAELFINSIGHPGCREEYLPKLTAFLESHFDELDEDCQRKTKTNPLRTFDCKVPRDRQILEGAPLITDFLCDDCREHFSGVQRFLADAEVEFRLDPRLVRGLDYYTRTTFAFLVPTLGAQNEVGGGGRYDGLSEMLGGPPLPGIGFGLGADRILRALGKQGKVLDEGIDTFVVSTSEEFRSPAISLARLIRDSGMSSDIDYSDKAVKAQFKTADRLGARFVIVVGQREMESKTYTVRNMSTGEEMPVAADELVDYLKGWL